MCFEQSKTFEFISQIYRIGKGVHIQDGKVIRNNASTNYDTSQKTITPMVGVMLWKTIAKLTQEVKLLCCVNIKS